LLFLGAYKFNVCYGLFSKIAAPRVAQTNPISTQKTPGFAHLRPQLRGNVDSGKYTFYLYGKERSIGELGYDCIGRDVPEALLRLM
jgi:hypothetical protein